MFLLKITCLILTLSSSLSTQTITNINHSLQQIAHSPLVNLIFVYDSLKMKTAEVKPYMDRLAQNKRGYFIINMFDCQEGNQGSQSQYCTKENRQNLPQLFFNQPMLNAFNQTTKLGGKQSPYQGPLEEKKLYQFALPLMKTYSRYLKSLSDLEKFRTENKDIPRIVYITDKQKLSTYYKALTANFRYDIAFAHVFSNNTKICNSLNVSAFPALILNQKYPLQINSHISEQIQYMKQFTSHKKFNITVPASYEQGDQPIQNNQDLEKKVLLVPKYSLIHVTDGKEHPAWKSLKKKLMTGFQYFTADKSMASELGVRHFPSIVFYHRSISKKDLLRTNFHEKISFRNIVDQITDLIDDFSVAIGSHEEMQRQTGVAFRENQKIVCLFHDEEIPLSYRILSNMEEYKNKLQFYRYKNPEPKIIQQFRINKKFPVMMVMYVSDDQFTQKEIKEMDEQNRQRQGSGVEYRLSIGQYNGIYIFDDMKIFLDGYLKQINKKSTMSQNQYQEEYEGQQRQVLQVKSKKHLNKYCIKDSCYLVLVDNNPQYSESAKRALNYTKSITKRVHQKVVWMDAVCHSNLLSLFQVQEDDLPVLVYINHKFQKYSKLIGRLTATSPIQFVSKIKNNQINYRNYEKLSVQDKNCVEQHAKMDALKFRSQQLTEQQREILQQIKREEQLKRKQADDALSKSKRKNKKKPKRKTQQEDSEL